MDNLRAKPNIAPGVEDTNPDTMKGRTVDFVHDNEPKSRGIARTGSVVGHSIPTGQEEVRDVAPKRDVTFGK